MISSASKDPFRSDEYRSISIGVPINKNLLSKVSFTNSKMVDHEEVGVTCERCSIENCDLRQAAPKHLHKEQIEQQTIAFVTSLQEKYKKNSDLPS